MSEQIYRRDLGTNVIKLEYDFANRVGTLYMPELCCTDMTGTIALFKRIDPEVEEIHTISGEKPDVIYVGKKNQWYAQARFDKDYAFSDYDGSVLR